MGEYASKVAIITRTKDRPAFLKRALRSVSGQVYDNYTHVIVNDGGDVDVVNEIIDKLSAEQKSKTILFHREVSSNAPDTIFTESIDRVDSKYFAIHDDDDTWHPDFLSETVGFLDNNGDKAAVVVRTDKVVEEVRGGDIVSRKTTQWMSDIKAISLYRQCIDNQLTPISTLYRRECYEQVGKFDDTLPVVGDWEFGVRLLKRYDVGYIDTGYALANYHHRNSIGTSQDTVSSHDKHRYYTNKIMNRLLREEIAEGRLGVGYIMSQLKYNQTYAASIISRVLPSRLVSGLKNRLRN